ncbi:MAG: hypothetical protein ABJH98_17790 [Reichenbachiella sp.]|uniref:hypothetical protein n=1 Tax=Reichenbachiella sp. TaxID=2184521 RepID=UPI003296D20C
MINFTIHPFLNKTSIFQILHFLDFKHVKTVSKQYAIYQAHAIRLYLFKDIENEQLLILNPSGLILNNEEVLTYYSHDNHLYTDAFVSTFKLFLEQSQYNPDNQPNLNPISPFGLLKLLLDPHKITNSSTIYPFTNKLSRITLHNRHYFALLDKPQFNIIYFTSGHSSKPYFQSNSAISIRTSKSKSLCLLHSYNDLSWANQNLDSNHDILFLNHSNNQFNYLRPLIKNYDEIFTLFNQSPLQSTFLTSYYTQILHSFFKILVLYRKLSDYQFQIHQNSLHIITNSFDLDTMEVLFASFNSYSATHRKDFINYHTTNKSLEPNILESLKFEQQLSFKTAIPRFEILLTKQNVTFFIQALSESFNLNLHNCINFDHYDFHQQLKINGNN